jgi:hypothetical protein
MKLTDVQSPEWRARAASRVSKKLLGFARATPKKSPVLIAGLQRSGTTMLMNIFHLHPETDVFDEARESKAFFDFRIRSVDIVRQVIADSHFRFPCFKTIADSHILPTLMRGLQEAKVIWMYREHSANAASRLKKFGHATAAIRAVCEGKLGGGWFSEGVSTPIRRSLQSLDRSGFSDFDYACLVWWARNQLFFDLGLATEPRVRLLRYETLVVDPKGTMSGLFRWLDMPSSGQSMRFVHAQSLFKRDLPALDPQVEMLCSGLQQRLDEAHQRQWRGDGEPEQARQELRLVS